LDTELVGVIQTAASRFEPSVVVGPAVLAGFSDSRLLREAGIVSYGFDPFLRKKETRGPHGVDERLPISELGAAVRFCHEVVRDYAAGRRPSD